MKSIVGNIVIIMLIKNFFIALLVFFSVNIYAKNIWFIEDIRFNGLKNISQKEVLKNIFFTVGNQISQNDIQNSIQSLFKTGKFEDIKAVYFEKSLIFNIKEKPIISSVIFSGNNNIQNSILDKYLIKLGISKNSSLNPFLINVFIKNIEDFYHNLGRCQSSVKVLKLFSDNNTVRLKIVINEGTLTKVKKIKIFGNHNFSEEKLLSFFKLKDHKSWWNILDTCVYSPQDLQNDLKNMSDFYLNQGYFYFHLNRKKIQFLENENNVNIVINISEGQQYRISNFVVNGYLLGYYKSILDMIKIDNNELYNQEKINSIVHQIKRFLSENGYIYSQVIVNPKVNYEKRTITLDFNINVQERFFVNRIFFNGNESTQDLVLRRELKQIEGDYFNIKNVELGKDKLDRTKYFSDVKILKNILSYDSNQVNITYQVKEQPTGSINFGLGYGVNSGISFHSFFSQENLLGSGNSFQASAIKNDIQKKLEISMRYPYFIFNNSDLNIRFFYNHFKYNLNSISNPIKDTHGFENNLELLINDNNKLNFGFGYTYNDIISLRNNKNISSITKKSDLFFLKNTFLNDFTLNYSWMFNTLKYAYFPISGNQTYISGKNTIPGSDNNFYKIILDSEQYIPLNNKQNFIFLSHIHMGIGNGFFKKNLPFYEKFHADSSNNIRGFRAGSIGPKVIYNNIDFKDCIGYKNSRFCESFDSIGGNATIVTNFELITPTPLINKKYSPFFRSSFFLDIGNIWNTESNNIQNIGLLKSEKNSSLDDIYASFGVSLQWFSPIGPLMFSYSYPLQKNKNSQLEIFQFNFGKNW